MLLTRGWKYRAQTSLRSDVSEEFIKLTGWKWNKTVNSLGLGWMVLCGDKKTRERLFWETLVLESHHKMILYCPVKDSQVRQIIKKGSSCHMMGVVEPWDDYAHHNTKRFQDLGWKWHLHGNPFSQTRQPISYGNRGKRVASPPSTLSSLVKVQHNINSSSCCCR